MGQLGGSISRKPVVAAELEAAASAPVLQAERFKSPVVIASIEVLEQQGHYFVRTRSTDGAEGVAVTTERMSYLHPLLAQCVAPAFVGQDARRLDQLIERAYVYRSNYKLAGLALWCCIAWIELSVLDLLGKVAQEPVGALLGGVVRNEVPIYVASGNRATTPEQEVEVLLKGIAETGAKAVKFKVGGRMSQDADSLPGRSEALIRRARAALGDHIAIHADANGSYGVPEAIRIDRLLEEIGAFFYEEPCPFDHLEETKAVADTLAIPVAGGEQETSLRRFRWLIENDGVQVVQPDVQYNGGLIRTIRVARLAERAGVPTTLHISGEPGFIYTLHFASCVPNIGVYQEYKGTKRLGSLFEPPLAVKEGRASIPTGPGLGMVGMAERIQGARVLTHVNGRQST